GHQVLEPRADRLGELVLVLVRRRGGVGGPDPLGEPLGQLVIVVRWALVVGGHAFAYHDPAILASWPRRRPRRIRVDRSRRSFTRRGAIARIRNRRSRGRRRCAFAACARTGSRGG